MKHVRFFNFRPSWLVAFSIFILAGCGTINTLPTVVDPDDPTQEFSLVLPNHFEIQNVDFEASMISDVDGVNGHTSSTIGGRAFVKVYAIDRSTDEQCLLIYENIAERKEPIQIIRFSSN